MSSSPDHPALASFDSFQALPPDRIVALLRSGGRAEATLGERIRIFLMMGRLRTCVVGYLCFVLGHAYTGAPLDARFAFGAFLCVVATFASNIYNTCSDLEEDARNLPGRMYLLAKFGWRPLCWSMLWLAVVVIGGGALLGPWPAAMAAISMLFIHQYSFRPVRGKARSILGPFVFAQAVYLAYLFALAVGDGPVLDALLSMAGAAGAADPAAADLARRSLAMLAYVTVWFMAKAIFKNVPDWEGDREAGVWTTASVFPSRYAASMAAAVATIAVYVGIAVLVALRLEPGRLLWSLLWLGPVVWNCRGLVRAPDQATANRRLMIDMYISCGLVATVLLLLFPSVGHAVAILSGGILIVGSDLLKLDTRRAADVRVRA